MNLLSKFRKFFRQRLPVKISAAIIACIIFLFFLGAAFLNQKVRQILALERANFNKPAEIPFKKGPHPPHHSDFVKIWQNTNNTRDIAAYKNSIFAATDGGLVEFDESGDALRHFTVLDGLPESDLVCLAVFQSKLFIGTRTKGLVSFDGEKFESFELENHPTGAITAFFIDSRTLLIGTFSGGVLDFDGRRFVEIKNENNQTRFEKITSIFKTAGRFFIGTFDNGLWANENGVWRQFTKSEGLPSNRITGFAIAGEQIFIATDLGLAKLEVSQISQPQPFQNNLILPTLSGIANRGGLIFLTKSSGEVFSFPAAAPLSKAENLKKLYRETPENFTDARLLNTENQIWLAGNRGVWKLGDNLSFRPFSGNFDKNQPTGNVVSALALDAAGRLWIGHFRGGIDVFSADGKKTGHIENESVREINFLLSDSNSVRAATSGGIFDFDKSLNISSLKKSDGLISNSVMHISQISSARSTANPTVYYATNRGLMFSDKKDLKAMTTVNGLPGNNIFTTLVARNALFVGTLNGLAQIENGKVVRVYKDSNSNLKQNWVTALCLADERIFIGTYGGGIFELLSSGEIRSFAEETGKFVVNPNAIYSDGERLFVGTLEGVRILNLISQKWTNEKDFLPAETVLSITGNRENIFFGTTGGIAQTNRNYWIDKAL